MMTDIKPDSLSLKGWGDASEDAGSISPHAVIDCGWGRLIFGQTFSSAEDVAEALQNEEKGQRDVAFYVRDPHVVLATSPQTLFLDPSHSFRLDLSKREPDEIPGARCLTIRPATGRDVSAINRLYLTHGMVPISDGFCDRIDRKSAVTVVVAEEAGAMGSVVGVAMGVDHRKAFNDPENGSSFWALAVDPQAKTPGIGRALVEALAAHFEKAGRHFMDLSVMHDNEEAIALYRKLGFERIPVYSVKRKNLINEKLFVGPQPESDLNIYAQILVDEARRRGIAVDVEDAEAGLFRLSYGGRSVACRESLSDLTSAVALSRCDDKRLTRRLLKRNDLSVPDQMLAADKSKVREFLQKYGRVVVKPARGEMGRGISVDLRTEDEVARAINLAREQCEDVIVEQYVEGQDLRIVVIDGAVVAAAVRKPPTVLGDGVHTVIELIDRQSRRREAATGGESKIPLDEETERCVQSGGAEMLDVPDTGETLTVRKTANLHAGGTIHDVTENLHPDLADAAIRASQVLEIPVVGFDLIVPDPSRADYVVIEANERPGLANHEPQPTAERFIDFLFPQTKTDSASLGGRTDARPSRRSGLPNRNAVLATGDPQSVGHDGRNRCLRLP